MAALWIASIDCSAQTANNGILPSIKTVFIILEENHNWSEITPALAPYIRNTLVPMGAHAEQYYNPPGNHPSEPNYIWLEAGSNLGITNDNDPIINHQSTTDHLVSYLNRANISWKSYAEDIDGKSCPVTSIGNYAAKHNPFVFFDDVTASNTPNPSCISRVRPYTELANDLQNNTVARYNFIVPNLCDDMHDCSVTAGDTWLSTEVPKILASQAYKDGGALLITWDEGEGAINPDGPIGMMVLSPFAKTNYSNTIHYSHSSTLKTLQEIFGVAPLLRDAANASDLSDLFIPGPLGTISVNDGGVVNNASYNLVSSAVAPGAIVAIFGSNMTDGTSCLAPSCNPAFGSNGKLNTSMSAAQVMIDGAPVPIFYASPSQLGVQVPVELTGTSAAVQVAVGGQISPSRTVAVIPASPGIFTFTQDGKGTGAITHVDGTSVTSQNPAHPGEIVILYATGLGRIAPIVPTGTLPAGISVTVSPATVTIDGIVVIPDFAGLAGCCVGLNQVNVLLPSNTRSANDIPVVLSIAGVKSNTVTIAVK